MTWAGVIERLNEWKRNPAAFADEGIDPPHRLAIDAALEYCDDMRPALPHGPTRACTTGDGGISFEWQAGDEVVVVTFELSATISTRTIKCKAPTESSPATSRAS